MAEAEKDLASLASKIAQLEERQNITAKYAVAVKRQLDELSTQFYNLQQCLEKPPNLSISLNNVEITNLVEAQVNVDADEIDVEVQQEENVAVFSDEGFKIARMTQLLGVYGDILILQAYLAEENASGTPMSVEEFWLRYKTKRERDFTGVNLAGSDLTGNSICHQINLSKANLAGAKLSGDWIGSNFSEANLSNANLSGANLSEANLNAANLDDADLHQAKLQSAKLEKATLIKANLSGANLSQANFGKAKLMRADLSNANLINANFIEANLEGANLSQAYYNTATIFPSDFDAAEAGA